VLLAVLDMLSRQTETPGFNKGIGALAR